MSTTTTPLSFSIVGAAAATGLSRSYLDRAIKSGDLPAKKSSRNDDGQPTGKWLILTRDLESFLERLADA